MPAEAGMNLSHYRLVEKIGEGGMGVVWKAEDTVLGRTVAVKVLPAGVSRDETRRKMFLDEARLASSVSAAQVVQVFDFGREGDLDFIVMEFVDGNPLQKILHGRPLPPEKVAEIGLQIAQALSKTHRRGLLHRDIKPANVLITSDGDVKVVDFGLAALYSPPAGETGTGIETRTARRGGAGAVSPTDGLVAGTIPYMSPEQIRAEKLDARSDIFSLGAVLYEMTTGQRPFTGPSHSEVAAAIQRGRPRPVHEIVPEVPLDLNRIIQKSLAPRPADRYQTMEDLAVDLKRLGRDLESGSSPSYADLEKGGRRAGGGGWLWGAAAVAAVLAVGGGAWLGGWIGGGDLDPDQILILPMRVRGQSEGADYVGLAFAEAIAVNLAQSEGLRVLPVPERGAGGASASGDPTRPARRAGAGRLLTGSMTRIGDRVQANLSLLDAEENRILWGAQREISEGELTDLAAALAREMSAILGTTTPKQYDAIWNLTGGREMSAYPATSEAVGAIRRGEEQLAVAATERLVRQFPDELDARVLHAYALLLRWQEETSGDRMRMLRESIAAVERIDPASPYGSLFRAWIHSFGGMDFRQFGIQRKYPGSGGRGHEAIALLNEVLERNDLTPAARVEILQSRAWPKRNIGDMEGALADLEEALELDPTNASLLSDLGSYYHETGQAGEAIRRTRQAVALEPSNWAFHHQLSRALKGAGELDGSTEHARLACELNRHQQPCAFFAIQLLLQGEETEALAVARQAEELPENIPGTYNLACFWSLAGEPERALPFLRRSIELGAASMWMANDPDLEALHGHPEFEKMMDEVKRRIESD